MLYSKRLETRIEMEPYTQWSPTIERADSPQPNIWHELCGAWLMCPWTCSAEGHRLTWVFLCDVTLPRWRRLSFLGHPHTASEDFGDAPSFSESFYWSGNHPVKATRCKFMPQDFRIWNNWSSDKGCTTQPLKNILLNIIFLRINLK